MIENIKVLLTTYSTEIGILSFITIVIAIKKDLINEFFRFLKKPKIELIEINLPDWVTRADIRYRFINFQKRKIVVDKFSIHVIYFEKIIKVAEKFVGATQKPIKGTVNITNKTGLYPINFDDGINEFSYREDDYDLFIVEVTPTPGYLYKCRFIAHWHYLDSSKEYETNSDFFDLSFPQDSIDEILNYIDEKCMNFIK